MEPVTAVAVGLLVLGVIGSVLPLLPGALLSLMGVYLHWWHTGYAEPGRPALAALTVVGVTAVAADYFGGAVAARAGGASIRTTLVAGLVGIVLLFVVGPLGVLLGVGAIVLAVEVRRHGDVRRGTRAALYAVVGALGSVVVQVLLTASMLVAFVLIVL